VTQKVPRERLPRQPRRALPSDWQISPRTLADGSTGHYLQRRRADWAWEDVAGPYKQRGTAYETWRRIAEREQHPVSP
jgi:hypothetical protein